MDKQTHNNFKIGDIITTYSSGFWRLDRIQARFITEEDSRHSVYKNYPIGTERSPIFYYTRVADKKGKIVKSTKLEQKSCDASFCSLAIDAIPGMLREFEEQTKNLQAILMLAQR